MEGELLTDVVQSFECLNASLANFLSIWGYKVMPEDIFFLGRGFYFKIVNKQGVKHLASDAYISSFHYMDKMKICYMHDFYKNTSRAKQFICDAIANRHFMALKIRSDYLTYNKVFKQTIASHYVSVIAYDEESNEIYVVDGDVPTMIPSSFAGWVDTDTIIEGWEKTDFEYIDFICPDSLPEITDTQILAVIKKQLDNYLSDELGETGSNALWALFEQLSKMQGEELSKVARDINYQLRTDGFFASREYLIHCLLRFPEFESLIQDEQSILLKWNSVCMMCIKVSISKRTEEIAKLTSTVRHLLLVEKEIFCRVADVLSNILN